MIGPSSRPALTTLAIVFVLISLVSVAAGGTTGGPNDSLTHDRSAPQDTTDVERIVDRAIDRLLGPEIELGALVQTVGRLSFDPPPGPPGTNQFGIGTARLRLSGGGDTGFRYMSQLDFTRSLVLLDARVGYSFSPGATLRAGLFKTPFSGEFLTSAAAIDFVNRARVVGAYAPNRDVGINLFGRAESGLSYSVGVFNGNGRTLAGNDNNRFMYVGRIGYAPDLEDGTLEIAADAATSKDAYGGFRGRRTWMGADARFERGAWLLAGEVLYARTSPDDGSERMPLGYHLTAGYSPVPGRHQIVFRLDQVDHDVPAETPTQVVAGYNFFATDAYGLQLNYVMQVGEGADVSDDRILANFQVAL